MTTHQSTLTTHQARAIDKSKARCFNRQCEGVGQACRPKPRSAMSDVKFEGTSVPDQLRNWLTHAVQAGASDLHLIAGHPPILRLHGDLVQMPEPPLEADETHALLCSLCR